MGERKILEKITTENIPKLMNDMELWNSEDKTKVKALSIGFLSFSQGDQSVGS